MPGEDIFSWSTTAADNATADLGTRWPEGMARNLVNNSARGLMAALAKNRDLRVGAKTTDGLANAQTFLSGVGYTVDAVPIGLRVLLKVGSGLTNTGPTTLNVDVTGAVAVKTMLGKELAGKEFTENAYVEVLYDGTNWILLDIPSTSTTILINQQIASSSSALIFTTGLDDTYDEYLFVMTGLAGQPAGQIGVQISIDAGATWLAAPNYWSAFQHISSHNAAINQVYGNFNGSNALFTISGIYDAVAHHLMDGEFRLFRPGKTGSYKHCIFHTSVVNSQDVNGEVQSVGGGCNVGTLAPINGIRFFSTPGVIPSGTIHMYGVSRS